jgi:hypothetical protein
MVRFALDEHLLTIFDEVKVGGIVPQLAFVLVFDGQRLLLEPRHGRAVVEEVNEIAFEQ